jgi:hypothetical protein
MSPAVKVVPPPARHPTASLPSPSKPFYTRTRRFSLPLQSLTNPNPNSTSSSVATACINPPLAFATTDISSLAPILHESDSPTRRNRKGRGRVQTFICSLPLPISPFPGCVERRCCTNNNAWCVAAMLHGRWILASNYYWNMERERTHSKRRSR